LKFDKHIHSRQSVQWPRNQCQLSCKGKRFFSSSQFADELWVLPSHKCNINGRIHSRVKLRRRETHCSYRSGVCITNAWNYITTYPYTYIKKLLNNLMDPSVVQGYVIRRQPSFMASYSVFSKQQQHEGCRNFLSAGDGTDINLGY